MVGERSAPRILVRWTPPANGMFSRARNLASRRRILTNTSQSDGGDVHVDGGVLGCVLLEHPVSERTPSTTEGVKR